MKYKPYNDFLEDIKIPKKDRTYCKSCEQWIPKSNPVHTCWNAKEIRKAKELKELK